MIRSERNKAVAKTIRMERKQEIIDLCKLSALFWVLSFGGILLPRFLLPWIPMIFAGAAVVITGLTLNLMIMYSNRYPD